LASLRFGIAPLTVTFTNTTEGLSGAATYLWRFGDGTTSTTTHPTHTYTQTGLYTVSLQVTDGVFTHVQTRTHYISVGDARVIEYEYDGLYRLVEADYRSTGLTTGTSGEYFAYTYTDVWACQGANDS
jgi:PKD repeat protein